MASRRATTLDPAAPQQYPDDFTGDVIPFAHSGLDLFNETGDMSTLLDDDFRDWSWTVYRMMTPDEMRAAGASTPRVFVTKTVGPFDVLALQRNFGGGVYEIRGTFDKHLRIRKLVPIEGPRRVYETTPTPARPFLGSVPVAPEPAPLPQQGVAGYELMRRLDAYERALEKIMDRVSAPAPAAPAPAAPPMGIADVLALADRLNKRDVATPTGETVKEIMDVLRMGMDLKGEVAGGPETSTAERVVDKVLPSLERLLLGIFTSRGAPRIARGVGAAVVPASPGTSGLPEPPPVVHHPASVATVESPASPPVVEVDGSHRWPAAIEALVRSLESDQDPRDLPATLELILAPDDLATLAATPDEAVVAQLRSSSAGAFPVLAEDRAARYIVAVLAELRNPTDPAVE